MGDLVDINTRKIEIEDLKEERDFLNGVISVHESALIILEADNEVLKKENQALRLLTYQIDS